MVNRFGSLLSVFVARDFGAEIESDVSKRLRSERRPRAFENSTRPNDSNSFLEVSVLLTVSDLSASNVARKVFTAERLITSRNQSLYNSINYAANVAGALRCLRDHRR